MKVGIVPQYLDELGENRLFEFDGYDPFQAYGADRIGFHELEKRFERAGDAIDTVDLVDLSSLDAVIFVDMNFDYLDRLLSLEDPPALVYLMREPPSVRFYNAPSELVRYAPLFDRIFTWNPSLAAIDDRFVEYNIPQVLDSREGGGLPFADRDLLVNITSRKFSDHPDELYSARRAVIEYYDRNHPDQFTLYGRYWNDPPRPEDLYHHGVVRTRRFETYEGLAEDKISTYHHHRFALCFENMTGIDGYLTEKLFDCLRAGTVPVYWGAEDVTNYLPEDAFVDYRKLGSPEALHEYLSSMGESEYRSYLEAAASFLGSGSERVSPEQYVRTIHGEIEELSDSELDSVPEGLRAEVAARGRLDRLENAPEELSLGDTVRAFGRSVTTTPGMAIGRPSAFINPIAARIPLI